MALRQQTVRHRGMIAASVVLLAAAGVSACASSDASKALNPDPPAKMYADADLFLAKGRFEEAGKKFEDLDRDHPYAPEARRAMVMAAYSYYKAGKYPEAIAAARRYTTLHPGTKDAALAHHVIASSYFAEIKDPAHDQTAARRALTELKVLATRYPESQYARQAENRMRICEDNIAANEMYVGRYYLKGGNYVAAINRFKVVVSDFQTTPHVEEALMRLTEAYVALGVVSEAQTAAAVLGHNFPESQWYKSAYATLQGQGLKPKIESGSWISQQLKKIIPGPAPKVPPQEPTLPPEIEAPPARAPSPDTPTASTKGGGKQMGLIRTN